MLKIILFTGMFLCFALKHLDAQNFVKVDLLDSCQVKVYVTNDPSKADLKVFLGGDSEKAKENKGHWIETTSKKDADVRFFFVNDPAASDIIIYYVNNASEAGWIDNGKQQMFESLDFKKK